MAWKENLILIYNEIEHKEICVFSETHQYIKGDILYYNNHVSVDIWKKEHIRYKHRTKHRINILPRVYNELLESDDPQATVMKYYPELLL